MIVKAASVFIVLMLVVIAFVAVVIRARFRRLQRWIGRSVLTDELNATLQTCVLQSLIFVICNQQTRALSNWTLNPLTKPFELSFGGRWTSRNLSVELQISLVQRVHSHVKKRVCSSSCRLSHLDHSMISISIVKLLPGLHQIDVRYGQ